MFISYKEARETHYWIRLLRDSGILESKLSESLLRDCDELLKLSGNNFHNKKVFKMNTAH